MVLKAKKKLKKMLSVVLAVMLLATPLTVVPISASAATQTETIGALSGTTGDCTWRIEDDTLIISGNGAMEDYNWSSSQFAPWKDIEFSNVIIENGNKYWRICVLRLL